MGRQATARAAVSLQGHDSTHSLIPILPVIWGTFQDREMPRQGLRVSLEIHLTAQVTHKLILTPSVMSTFEIINSF